MNNMSKESLADREELKYKKKLLLSLSGGMDSVVLLHLAVDKGYDNIHTISFDYGQRHKRELECIEMQFNEIYSKHDVVLKSTVIDARFLSKVSPTSSLTNTDIDNPDISKMAGDAQPVSYVPFRNQMFNTIACAYAESHDEYIDASDKLTNTETVKKWFEDKHKWFLESHKYMKIKLKSEQNHLNSSGFSETSGIDDQGKYGEKKW